MTPLISRRALLLLVVMLACPVLASDNPDGRRIDGLQARHTKERAVVSFTLANCLDDEMEERIHSGIAVGFKHRVDVVSRRGMWLPARTLARSVVRTTAEYDSLTQQYTLRRTIEMRPRRKRDAVEPVEEQRKTRSIDEMRAWMTQVEELPVYDPAQELVGEALRVRVHSVVGRRYLLLIFPSTVDVSAELRLDE